MSEIELLSQETIDKIAAGEVVERPASVVKELVENAIDAGASIITVEIEKGGTSKIRVSDNGVGIGNSEVKKAFLRHSTSKIKNAEDLNFVTSLGFRGEALSSIAAVSKLELITKTEDEMLGTLYETEGAVEKKFEEIGAPDGSTFIIRDLFYNTLPRKKFLKSPRTEGNLICEIVEKLSLSHPEIAFQLSVDRKNRLSTIGTGRLKDCIYQIYGKEITKNLIPIDFSENAFNITGFIGNPSVIKGNRSYENIYVNERFVKSNKISKAVEEGYTGFLMQHQYPFICLMIDIDTSLIDVNVHPTKMEIRIDDSVMFEEYITDCISNALHGIEDIREDTIHETPALDKKSPIIEPYETIRCGEAKEEVEDEINKELLDQKTFDNTPVVNTSTINETLKTHSERVKESVTKVLSFELDDTEDLNYHKILSEPGGEQLSFLSEEAVKEHKIIGQLFDTYWLVEFDNSLYIIDQHAAHEKVLYEKTVKLINDKRMTTQQISPPIIVTLSSAEEEFLSENIDIFNEIGYEIENFGGKEYAINGIPDNIYNVNAKSLFLEMIGDCINIKSGYDKSIITDKIASMSCKAAIKGNMNLTIDEAKSLIDELLQLDNPFHCPHGRPTIIKMSKYEIEKKFGRIQ